MAQKEQESANRTHGRLALDSKFWKTLLIVLAAFLIFVGPTYAVLVLYKVLDLDYAVSMGSGFVLFAVGLVLMWYLIRRNVIS